MPDAQAKLKLAQRHLEKVLVAWDAPTDWDDLSLYGFYCLASEIERYVDAVKQLLEG